ncbi:hypothetical protein COT44_00475 [Candidatus Shapirobacteria bacterium CG08_land_8_20_14_0_20_39_18]|uniref:Uncharacterized protein n=1 Tax=Candidatus Shapirobacteria bacterium CG08_land_8_20_14_0_20_39_18 TaxID=1974883 RepID=A0A2M6XEA2_9BACT|nr:MAG: hypothetical protein COT44_00475 [Candidatus Shapirobacteria bacterium CG08_land_8_20_14_0_20_39_18]PIY66440.1 MAG: hypothetical protein COY91_00665 [Candidatus Shapirobacteria bacterium CG_4_10_14_0_8_um_filter_39_15]PJE68412.1 MAG: hypothetical protein COU94_02075 [Candidatus Shapirobacteria bacterium CG10_big_fil_rev_8_21_14_0_10_38_8]
MPELSTGIENNAVSAGEKQFSKPILELVEGLRQTALQAEIISIPGATIFKEAVLIDREKTGEKMVRVFRGVIQLDKSITNQTAYAARSQDYSGADLKIIEEVKPEVELLADQPSYESLVQYANKIRPYLTEKEQERLDRDLRETEDNILEGSTLRTELVYHQILHLGVVADSGITPYLSASYDFTTAWEYTREGGGLLVIDLPVSRLVDFGPNQSEVNIKGYIKPGEITAIVPRVKGNTNYTEIGNVLSLVTRETNVPLYELSEALIIRGQQYQKDQEWDKRQHSLDVEAIRKQRTEALREQFSEVDLNPVHTQALAVEKKTDIYQVSKELIYDFYAKRFGEIGGRNRKIEDYDYGLGDQNYFREKFDRDKITDEMLVKLREQVGYTERKEKEWTN